MFLADVNSPPVSWCKLEAVVNNMNQITVTDTENDLKPPPIVQLTLNMKTALNTSTHENEVESVFFCFELIVFSSNTRKSFSNV